MYQLVTQKHRSGCGIACIASFLGYDYETLLSMIPNGDMHASERGFYCRELVELLKQFGYKKAVYLYIKSHIYPYIYTPGTIVFIKRSRTYPVGHYLLRTPYGWMDPWKNFPVSSCITVAESGIRKRLPGTPIYAIFPHEIK
jgi:hypothetical protein